MAIIIGAVLCLFSIAVLLYPFYKAYRAGSALGTLDGSDESPQELESVYEAIRTLRLEHQLGRIPEASYEEQLAAYRFRAAEILRSWALGQDANRKPDVSRESEEAALEREILLTRGMISPGPVTRESDNTETVA